ncbi:MAG: mechanosensitive ion channel family protein [bacterium]|nr:mechanosensitive ion channel family protein [bacterium]
MQEFLGQTYYGNTVANWGLALLIALGAIIVGKILYWVFGTVFRRLTAKTETKFDDIILDMIEEPIVVVVTVAGVWYGLKRLVLPDAVDTFIGNVTQVLIVLSVAWLIARLFDSLFKQYLAPLAEKTESDLDDQLLPILRKGTKMVVWALGVIVALNNAGYDVGAVLAGLGIGGLALAMAAKDTVSNIFGGFTIFTDRPFTLNDRIKIAGFDGSVKEIGIRSTRLQTLAGTMVTIPNSTFAESPVENITLEPSRKVVTNLGLTYDTSPEGMQKGIDLLRTIATEHEALNEKVVTAFNAFGDFAMNIIFIYYILPGNDILETQTDINLRILKDFTAEGLDFAFPTQTILATVEQGAA